MSPGSKSEEEEKQPPARLKVATASPGTMAKTAAFTSPFAMFTTPSARSKFKSYDFGSESEASAKSTAGRRLGIVAPSYGGDDSSVDTTESERIGIIRPDYTIPAGEIPISPLDLVLRKQKGGSPTPNLVNDSDDESADARNWDLNLVPPEPKLGVASDIEDGFEQPDDGLSRFVHQDTSQGHYLVGSEKLNTPVEGMRYSLVEGKKGMPKDHRRLARGKSGKVPTKPNLTKSINTPLQAMPESTSFKVFMLLIQPKSKIFELIQVMYSPLNTTVGDLLRMIPENSTEPALGKQEYIGLCRPKDSAEITDMSLMASGHHPGADCAKITLGEILVAIPSGYNGEVCSIISVPILNNPKIARLLKRSDPLAPKRRKSKRKSKSRSSAPIIPVKAAAPESLLGAEAKDGGSDIDNDELLPPPATPSSMNAFLLQGAAAAALAAGPPDEVRKNDSFESYDDRKRPASPQVSTPRDISITQVQVTERMMEQSLSSATSFEDSLYDNSLAFQPRTKRIPRRGRRRQRRTKRKQYAFRMAAASLSFMIGRFLMDPDVDFETSDAMDQAMGFLGLFQTLILFLGLCKVQKKMQDKDSSIPDMSKQLSTTSIGSQLKTPPPKLTPVTATG